MFESVTFQVPAPSHTTSVHVEGQHLGCAVTQDFIKRVPWSRGLMPCGCKPDILNNFIFGFVLYMTCRMLEHASAHWPSHLQPLFHLSRASRLLPCDGCNLWPLLQGLKADVGAGGIGVESTCPTCQVGAGRPQVP